MEGFLTRVGKLQVELKAPKGQTNKFGGYKYRSCEDILEAVKPLLDKHRLVLTVEDVSAVAAILQDNAGWLVSSGGKILEEVTSAQAAQYPQITGVELLMPSVGEMIEFPASGNATEEQVLGLLSALEDRGTLGKLESIDCSDRDELVMSYDGRFQVVMNYDDNFTQDLEALEEVIAKLQPNETGTIRMTNLEDIRFVPDA